MNPVPPKLVEIFASVFSGDKVGFSAKEIIEFFGRYSRLVRPVESYFPRLNRRDLFFESLVVLEPRQQYFALNDLCKEERKSKYAYPSEAERRQLLEKLHSWISPHPIGLRFSSLSQVDFRLSWVSCVQRLSVDPAGAITAARSLLESILKSIITERGGVPDSSGNLGKLLKEALRLLEFGQDNEQSIREIMSGFSSVINGISSMSNSAGDRHGLVPGQKIDDPRIAELCIHASGTVGISLIDFHLLSPQYT